MAVVEPIQKPIKAHQYVYDSIAYILSPENRNGDEKCFRATCLNCSNNGADGLAEQFYQIRRAYNKDSGRLAHHYVQSFSPNEKITPELAHQIGVELAEKIAPGFQVIVSTHVDKDHVHNHIILNSVNMETGQKWMNNKTSLKAIWKESDRLCQQHGLTIIDQPSGLKGIDQTTQKLAEQGKSWKVDLCHALDEAVKLCSSKKQFIEFMKNKGFEIKRYSDHNITFQKIGDQKGIRADTLAKQFGDAYQKETLEKMMGFYTMPRPLEKMKAPKRRKPTAPYKSEFERMEKSFFQNHPTPTSFSAARSLQKLIRRSGNPFFLLLLIIIKLSLRKKCHDNLDRKYRRLHQKAKPQKRYHTKKTDLQKALQRFEQDPAVTGNIPYGNLVKAQGDNFRVKLDLSAVPKLYAYPFFFSAKLYSDHALVTVKAKDKHLLQKALELEDETILIKHNEHFSSKADYFELKKRAQQLGSKIEFLVIQTEQLEPLKEERDRFVALPAKDGKIRLAFLQQNKGFILHRLYPDKYKSKNDIFSVSRNSKVNTRLKSEAALSGQKLRYRELSKQQVEQLAESVGEDRFAVFGKNAKGESLNGKYNVTFKDEDTEKIERALNEPKTTKRKI